MLDIKVVAVAAAALLPYPGVERRLKRGTGTSGQTAGCEAEVAAALLLLLLLVVVVVLLLLLASCPSTLSFKWRHGIIALEV